jgi:hypothetical protein
VSAVLDDRRRKAVAAIGEQGHAEMLAYPPLALTPVSVTMLPRFHGPVRSHRTRPQRPRYAPLEQNLQEADDGKFWRGRQWFAMPP